MTMQFARRLSNQASDVLGSGVRILSLVALAAILSAPLGVRADVIGVGDIIPSRDENGVEVPDLPQFGSEDGIPEQLIIVGGTNFEVGGTATGQLTIDIPSDTDPLLAVQGIIGGNIFGLGQVRVLGLNSEFRLSQYLVVGWEGQAFLEVAAGGRAQRVNSASPGSDVNTNPGDEWEDYDMVLGAWEGSQGFVEIDGFASLVFSGNLGVGHRGQGRIDMTNGSRMITQNEAVVGTVLDIDGNENAIGDGYVLVDGAGSRWNVGVVPTTADPLPGGGTPPAEDQFDGLLTVGRQGRGTVEIRNKGWVRVETDTILGDEAESFGKVVVSGANSLLWTLEDLFVGNAAGTAAGELHLDLLGEARADGDGGAGGVFVGPRGFVNMTGGTLLAPNVENNGVIRGDGRVDVPFLENNGDIRNAAGIANQRERLLFTGDIENLSNIESIGGEMEFQGFVSNDGGDAEVVAIDAVMRFLGGVEFTGGAQIYLEDSVVWIPVGTPLVSAGAMSLSGQSTLAGDLDLTSSNELNVDLGNPFGRLEVIGDASLAGIVNISIADDYLPQIGDSFEIIEADALSGTFASVNGGGAGAGFWQATYTGTSAILNYVTDIVSPLFSDFDGNGVVDGADLDIWRMNFGKDPATKADGDANGNGRVDGGDFLVWQTELGDTFPTLPAAGVVPEPSGLAMAAVALAALVRRRKSA